MLEYLLKASGLIAIIYLGYFTLLQKETFFKSIRFYFLMGFVLTITLPLIKFPVSAELFALKLNSGLPQGIINSESSNSWLSGLIPILSYLYFVGVIVFSLKFLIQITSLVNLLSKHKTVKDGEYWFVETNRKVSPFSFLKFIVYNKSMFSEDELAHIIAHEKIHVSQKHSFDIIASNILAILLWFNPFVWLIKKSVDQNLEFLADSDAFKKVESRKHYQLTLLKTSNISFCSGVTSSFYNKLSKKRIIFLNKKLSNPISLWKYFLIIPMVLMFVYAFHTEVTAETTKNSEHKVEGSSNEVGENHESYYKENDGGENHKEGSESKSERKINKDGDNKSENPNSENHDKSNEHK